VNTKEVENLVKRLELLYLNLVQIQEEIMCVNEGSAHALTRAFHAIFVCKQELNGIKKRVPFKGFTE
jgi:hypothetical protein